MYTAAMPVSLQQHLAIIEDHRVRKIFLPVLLCALAFGISLHFMEPVLRMPFLPDAVPVEYSATFDYLKPLIEKTARERDRLEKERQESVAETGREGTGMRRGRTSVSPPAAEGRPDEQDGKALLRLVTGKTTGVTGPFGIETAFKGADGILEEMDAITAVHAGLKTSGPSRHGRKGLPGSMFSFGNMNGNGSGALEEALAALDGAAPGSYSLKKRSRLDMTRTAVHLFENPAGERDRNEIRALVNERIGGVKHAYNKMLQTHPGLRGNITVSFTIRPSGRVTNVRVERSNMGCPELEQAIIRVIRRWRFRRADCGNTSVLYPFVFAPGM